MSKIGELFKKANVNDDGTSKKLDSESFLASSREIWEQTLPEGITAEIAAQVHLHDQSFARKFSHAITARTYETGKESKVTIAKGIEAVEALELPGDLTIRGNVFTVKTPQIDYICGYIEFQTPSVNKAGVIIDKNNPGDLWDF